MISDQLNPQISVVVPTYKDTDELKACVQCLKMQNMPSYNYEIIIVNNDPETDLEGLFSGVTIIHELRPGSYAARNKGIDLARGEVIAFTDSDCTPKSNWLESGLAALQRGRVDRIAGHIDLTLSTNPSLTEIYEKVTAFDQFRNAKEGFSVTANLFVRRSIFEEVGYFDYRLFSGGDWEWNIRATEQGKSIKYSKEAIVCHPARATIEDLKKKSRRVSAGKLMAYSSPFYALFKMMMPPIWVMKKIIRYQDVSLGTKIGLIGLAAYIKIHGAFFALKVKFGITSASRS